MAASAKNDPQQKILYAWERKAIAPQGGRPIPYDQSQALIDAVWMAQGFLYPPQVLPLEGSRRIWAKANRLNVWLRSYEATPTWVILHELGHSMTGKFDGEMDAHGPDYLWIYMNLAAKFLKIPLPVLMFTAQKDGLTFNVGARPWMLDAA